MLFSSATFLFLFLPLTLVLHRLLPGRLRLPFLLIMSLLFYGWGEPRALPLMGLSILISYSAALLAGRYPKRRSLLMYAAVGINLIILIYFKYVQALFPQLSIALPAGISFYTFQAIGYCLDVEKRSIPAEKKLLPFATYIALYPQLIAGPIERYQDIRPQLERPLINWDMFAQGCRLFVIGLSKKMLIANPMGQLWERLLPSMQQNGWAGNWLALLAFAFQIYFDFSAYSDMARGLGKMLGIELQINFRYPYTAGSVTDFWRRWHITLSSWFREYLYIPLGGNRRGLPRQLLNILIVWALTGLWHGASLNFLLWGLYYAFLLMLDKLLLLRFFDRLPRSVAWIRYPLTFLVVLLGWSVFAITDLSELQAFLPRLFSGQMMGSAAAAYLRAYLPLLVLGALASRRWAWKLPPLIENLLLIGLLLLCVAALSWQGYNPFLYFRF